MKRLLLILILTLSFQSWTKADDIRGFEIEGISIGDNLINYMTKKEINKYKYYGYKSKDYYTTIQYSDNFENYQWIQFNIKHNDKKYIIESIEGGMDIQSFSDCQKNKKNIEKKILSTFSNLKVVYGKVKAHGSDPSGLSKVMTTEMLFNKTFVDGPAIRVMCTYWSAEIKNTKRWEDSLRVILNSKKFNLFLDKNFD